MSRYVLIDYMHLAHRCLHAHPLSTTVVIDGEPVLVDTTIPNYTIKNIFNYGARGKFFTGVFFEGGSSNRKQHFAKASIDGTGYKGNRSRMRGSFYEGVTLALNLMHNGKVSLYRMEGFEADDIIYSVVKKIKQVDEVTPIDVVTNDSDLLPLVDDQVSVYMRGTREFALDGCPTRRLYYQVTPETWDNYLSYTSAFRDYFIPFNSMLLFKLIRGDKADNVPGSIKGYGGKKYSALMQEMFDDRVDFESVFRYGVDFDSVMTPVLRNYFADDVIEKMKFIYAGLNMQYTNLLVPKQIEPGLLQIALNPLKINIVK